MSTPRPTPPPPLVSIVIPTYNRGDLTVKCIQSIYKNTRGFAFETIIVDNASADGTRDFLQKVGHIVRTILNPTNLGFARACNQGAAAARGRYVLFLNNDTEVHPGWLGPLVEIAQADPKVGMVGPKLVYPDGSLQHIGVGFCYGAPTPIHPFHLAQGASASAHGLEERDHEGLTAACVLLPRALFAEVGGFDEGFINGYEDLDLCFRLRERGLRLVYTPRSVVTHHESKSPGRFLAAQHNIERLHQRWLGRFSAYTEPTHTAPLRVDRPARAPVTLLMVVQQDLNGVVPAMEHLARAAAPQDEVVVVVRPGTDSTALAVSTVLRRHPGRIRLCLPEVDPGFGGAVALGLAQTLAPRVLVCTSSARVDEPFLESLLAAAPEEGFWAPVEGWMSPDPQPSRLLEVSISGALLGPRSGFASALGRRPLLDLLDLSAEIAAQGLPLRALPKVELEPVIDRQLSGPSARSVHASMAHLGAERVRQARGLSIVPASVGGPIPLVQGKVSMILLALDNLALTEECLLSVYAHTHHPFELVLVDNASIEDIAGLAQRLQAAHGNVVYVRNEENQGFAYGVNQGLAAATGEHLLLLNNDVVVTDGWLAMLLAAYDASPHIALVGPRTNKCAGEQIVPAVGYTDTAGLPAWASQWRRDRMGGIQSHTRLIGLCILFKRALLDRIGGLDTIFGLGNFEDDDFSLRAARAGYLAVIAHGCYLHHHGSATFRSLGIDFGALMAANWELFAHKWSEEVHNLGRYDAGALVARRPFDPRWDVVPVEFSAVYHPAAPPLPLGRPAPFLFVPDFGAADWAPLLARLLDVAGGIPVVVRLEPPIPALSAERGAAIRQAAGGRPVILHEAALPPAERGGLYTAARALVSCPGPRERFVAREARACGLDVIPAAEVQPGLARRGAAAR